MLCDVVVSRNSHHILKQIGEMVSQESHTPPTPHMMRLKLWVQFPCLLFGVGYIFFHNLLLPYWRCR